MNKYSVLWPSSLGLAILAIIEGFSGQTGMLNGSNVWIPVSVILLVLSLLVLLIRSSFKSIEERLTKLEDQKNK